MNNQIFKLTQKQYDELVERKRFLEEEAIPENSLEIEKAKEFGDLSENAEYHAAKDTNNQLLSELNQIDAKLNRSSIITHSNNTSEVDIGSSVKVFSKSEQVNLEFTLIGENGNGVDEVEVDSKLGKAVIGKKVGDIVSYEANNTSLGELYYEILEIS